MYFQNEDGNIPDDINVIQCAYCGKFISEEEMALSRKSNLEICPRCATTEALEDYNKNFKK